MSIAELQMEIMREELLDAVPPGIMATNRRDSVRPFYTGVVSSAPVGFECARTSSTLGQCSVPAFYVRNTSYMYCTLPKWGDELAKATAENKP